MILLIIKVSKSQRPKSKMYSSSFLECNTDPSYTAVTLTVILPDLHLQLLVEVAVINSSVPVDIDQVATHYVVNSMDVEVPHQQFHVAVKFIPGNKTKNIHIIHFDMQAEVKRNKKDF